MIDMASPDIYSVTTTVSMPRVRPSFLISAAWWPMPSTFKHAANANIIDINFRFILTYP